MFRVGSGGVEQTRLSLARKLDPDRYALRIVCLDMFGELPDMLRDAGCPVDLVGNGLSIFSHAPYRDTLSVIRNWKPDIIHGAVYEGVAVAAVAGRIGRVPIILGEETSDPVDRRVTGNILYRLLAGSCHHMLAVSPPVQRYLIDTIRVPAHKVSMVVNGVAEPSPGNSVVIETIRRRYGIDDRSFVIGTVCRLVDSHKRVSDLIRAMPMLQDQVEDPRLLVVGDGDDRPMLEELALSIGVAERVHFCGYQAVPANYYEVMDVFALASAHEAFGLVLVEAMFAGLPVVATRVGGIPSVVEDGHTGLLVEPLNPAQLASAMLDLFRTPERRREMGLKGRDRAFTEFGEGRYVREVDALYTNLLDRAAART